MTPSNNPPKVDRRIFLAALGVIPATAALLAACGEDASGPTVPTGPDVAGGDPAIRPQDDLYRRVNGAWLRDYKIPADKSNFGAFDEAADRTEEQLKGILDSISDASPGSDEQKIRDLYDGHLDLDGIERLGLTPIADLLATVDAAQTKTDLARVMGTLSDVGAAGLIGLYVSPDPKDSNRYLPGISQAGIGLPDRSYYLDPQYAGQRDAYLTYLGRIAEAAKFADPTGLARRVLDLETKIAASHWDKVKTRDATATYNLHTWAQLRDLAPGFDWNSWLAPQTDKPELLETIVVDEPSFVTTAGQLWNDVDVATWRDYLRIGVVNSYARYLPKAFADARFDFGKTLSGVTEKPPRWKSAVSVVDGTLGELLGKIYVERHFPPEAKTRAHELVDNLKAAYKVKFENSDWMSEPTGKAAIVKLDKMVVKIGYPDHWRDYSGLTITKGQLVKSIRAASTFESRRLLGKIGKPVDRTEWSMTPQTVNAYYGASSNEIVFPAAILQRPFFDKDATAAVNYGGIGAVIGHEIGHGFDDQGSKYDADGNLRDWWTTEDRAAFDKKTAALIAQYNGLVPVGMKPEQHVNGALTIGENLADLRGLLISLDAFRIAEQKAGAGKPNYTDIFLSWGRIWRAKTRPETQAQLLATDQHAPNEFRCNQVVRNIPEFYATFGVAPTDKLFLPEADRVSI